MELVYGSTAKPMWWTWDPEKSVGFFSGTPPIRQKTHVENIDTYIYIYMYIKKKTIMYI